ncbi:MAG: Arylsulfatase [Verrucomicrobiota bacterium]
MKRLLLLALLLLLFPHLSLPALGAPDSPRPNIVFLFADDWGWGDLSCHGHPFLKTPNLDRLAAEGTDFHQFHVLSPFCSPSRVAAMTGRYPARFGVNGVFGDKNPPPEMPDWLDVRAPMLPRYLKAGGYRTAHFGKWHMGDMPGNPTMAEYGLDETAVYHGPGPKIKAHDIGARAAAFIEANKDRPFFLNVWLHESHTAHDPTPESLAKWSHLGDEQKQVYAAVITDGDNAVGKVLDALERAGIARNTLVVFSSDNGPERTGDVRSKGLRGGLGSYYSIGDTGGLRGRKRSLFEGGVCVPFLVRWPGHTPAGVTNRTTVLSAADLLPTFCAAAGVSLPEDAQSDGENVLAAFEGAQAARNRPIFWVFKGYDAEPDWWPRLAVREGPWKLLLTTNARRVELHDLSADRSEDAKRDLAKEHPEVVERLSRMALDWYATLPTAVDPSCVSKARTQSAERGGRKKGSPAAAK